MAAFFPRDVDTIWRRYLDNQHHEVPLSALLDETVREISTYLDIEIYSLDDGLRADYSSLAALVGLSFGFVEALRRLEEATPTAKVIREWQERPNIREKPTVGNLVRSLIKLNRLDAVSDCKLSIQRDANDYLNRQRESRLPPHLYNRSCEILTMDDPFGGQPFLYDAFVCYNEDSNDHHFFMEMVQKLENPPFNLRFFFPSRNGLFGVYKYENDAKVMEERCKHVIIVLSPDYQSCEACSFQTSIAIGLSAKDPSRRIVPILINDYPEVHLKDILRLKSIWKFFKEQDDFKWRQLAHSVCRIDFLKNL